MPTSQTNAILEIVHNNGGFQTLPNFNSLIEALELSDNSKIALELYSSVSSYGLVPDCWTYSIVIRCHCKENDPIEGKRVLDFMIGNGFQPDSSTTLATLTNFLCKRGRIDMGFEVVKTMENLGFEPAIQTHNCLLKGLCYVGKVEAAHELLMNIKESGKKPDIYSYSVVMDGFCKVGRTNEAFELLEEAAGMGLKPNVVTYNALFTGYFKEGRSLEGVDLLKKMKEKDCTPDYISYSTLLHGLLKWGEIQAALIIYKEMVETGLEVDERVMNTLLRLLCRRSKKQRKLLNDAYQVFEKMIERGSVVYPWTYGLVIEAYCAGHEEDKALYYLRRMVGQGFSPRDVTFNKVIRALCTEEKVGQGLSVLVLMCGEYRIPNRVSFDSLIDGFNRRESLLGASVVYGAALKRGVVPEFHLSCT